VDDDPDIRNVVASSLKLDPGLTVKSCARGDEVLAIALECAPDLILCDVMMPVVDGPAVLALLRDNPCTAGIPLVFVTAVARASELRRLRSLGAAGVIVKPFDPMKLATTVRSYLQPATGLAAANEGFARRLHRDAAQLAMFREYLRGEPTDPANAREDLLSCAHKLAGAAGIFGFQAVSCGASALEESILEQRAGRSTPGRIEVDLDALLACIERQQASRSPAADTVRALP
jgi:CheY-like chemotaxis protein